MVETTFSRCLLSSLLTLLGNISIGVQTELKQYQQRYVLNIEKIKMCLNLSVLILHNIISSMHVLHHNAITS